MSLFFKKGFTTGSEQKWKFIYTIWERTCSKDKGFTLVELVVTFGIMVTILTIVLQNQSTYTDGAAIQGLADEISIAVTQAQVYGISVKELGTGTSDFSAAYGVEFQVPVPGVIDNAYIRFADRGSLDKRYGGTWACQTGGASECLEKVPITRGNKVSSICPIATNDVNTCLGSGAVTGVDISFLRPATEAQMTFFNSSGSTLGFNNLKGVKIVLVSPNNKTKTVTVYTTGQVSVK